MMPSITRSLLAILSLFAASTASAQSTSTGTQSNKLPGVSADGTSFTAPTTPHDELTGHDVNPYDGSDLKTIQNITTTYDKTQEIDVVIGGSFVVQLKNRWGIPIVIDTITLSQPTAYTVTVLGDNVIQFTNNLHGVTFEDLKRAETKLGKLAECLAWVKTSEGLLTLHLVMVEPRKTPYVYNLNILDYAKGVQPSSDTDTSDGAVAPSSTFNYQLNPAPLNPLNRQIDDRTDGTGPSSMYPDPGGRNQNTDLKSQSPEASPYSPYGPTGPSDSGITYYQPEDVNAPKIDEGRLPTAIYMIHNYDRQRARNATTDNDIQRMIIGKSYKMTSGPVDPDTGLEDVSHAQYIWLAEAYRFPKYQTTVLRVVWNNNQTVAQRLDPTRVGLVTGRFKFVPQVYGMIRQVVYPGQNNELFLAYRIPNSEVGQAYELIPPSTMMPVRDAGPQPLPQ